jgi:MFS family permease
VNFSAFRLGAAVGLTVSGLILFFLDWRALFYINIPIGIFGTLWARRRLRDIAKSERGSKVDWFGFITFSTSITSFLLALTFAAYGMSEITTVYVLLIIGVVTIVAFTACELRIKQPLLDLRLLRIREFTGGVIAQLLNSIAFGGVLLLISLYLQLVVGLTPFEAGIRIVPFELAILPFSILSGRLSARFGVIPFTTGGLALTSTSLLLLSTVNASTPYLNVLVYLILIGMGIGLFGAPNMSSIMSAIPPERRGVAAGFRTVMMNVGNTISLTLATLIMTFTLPLALITKIIGSISAFYISEANILLFVQGLKNTYVWLAVLDAIAIVPSVLRGKRSSKPPLSPREALTEV